MGLHSELGHRGLALQPPPKVPRGRLDPWLLHITSPTPTADPPLRLSKRLVGIDPVQTQASTVALGRLTTTKARETRHGFNHLPVSTDSWFGFEHRARVQVCHAMSTNCD